MSASNSSKVPSTFDLLRWPEEPAPAAAAQTPARQQPTSGIGAILLGTALTPEEAEALQKKRPNSELKKKEMSGSGIFSQDGDLDTNGFLSAEKPVVRTHKPGVSQISFGEEGSISPRKPTSLPEVAKQRELSGNLEAPPEEALSRRSTSTAKVKELVGSNIFAPPSEVPCGTDANDFENIEWSTPQKDFTAKLLGSTLCAFGDDDAEVLARKSNAYKAAGLSGNDIFKEDAPAMLAEKSLSAAKRKEITGNDIFADEKPSIRDHLGGIRKPPGGESSITLV